MFPPFRLDVAEERLWKGETRVTLRRKPFAILRYLVARPKQLVTHDELLAHVWRGAVVSDSAMRSHLHELRQVLGEGVIETVIGRGYRFVAELREAVDGAPGGAAAPPVEPLPLEGPIVVGRESEIGLLRAALESARAGRRQLCFVTGEPGIGKSTLVRAFVASLDAQAVRIACGACFEQHGAPEPYSAIIDAVGTLARGSHGSQALPTLVRHAPTFVAQMPQLLMPDQLADVTRRAVGSNEARQIRELCEALEALGSREPLVLVLEDLQWSDVATIDLLSMLGQRQERTKLLLIGTSRHAEIQTPGHLLNHALRSLVARSGALSIQLPSVGVAAVQSFIDRRFPGHALPTQLADLVARITGGTPLFMVSLLDELVGRNMLVERHGQWALAVPLEEIQAHRPASVRQLIDMQIDRLSPAEQRVLEAASVLGSEFSTRLAAVAMERAAEEVDDTCDSLQRRALFLRAEADARYAFSHALVQEVCFERSSPLRRQRWHRLIAEQLERDQRPDENAHLLAKHFDAAGEPARAVPAYLAAARQAAHRYATSDSVALCARALDLLPRLVADRERDMLEFQILQAMCQQVSSNSLSATFAGREPLAVYERAIEIARSLGDASRSYAAITQLCNYEMIIARYERSAVWTAELERIEEAHVLDPILLHGGIFARAYIAYFSGDLATALRLFEKLTPAEHEASVFHGYAPGRVIALGHLACLRWVLGDAERALEESLATIELAKRLENPVFMALGHVVRARLRYLRRDPLAIVEAEALPAVRAAAVDVGLHTEARAFALWVEAQRAPLALETIQPLLDDLDQRLEAVATCSTLVAQALIDVLRASGHLPQARHLAERLIGFARGHNERVYLPELLRLRGELCAALDSAAAERDYREAIELARSMGAGSLERRAQESLEALVRC